MMELINGKKYRIIAEIHENHIATIGDVITCADSSTYLFSDVGWKSYDDPEEKYHQGQFFLCAKDDEEYEDWVYDVLEEVE